MSSMRHFPILALLACAACTSGETARPVSPIAGQDFTVTAPVEVVFQRLQLAMARCWPAEVSGAIDDRPDAAGRRIGRLAVVERGRNQLGESELYTVDVMTIAEGTRIVSYRGSRFSAATVGLDHIHRRIREWANGQDTGC